MSKHIHHIIPKHMGGSDEPNNLVELSVEEHAEAHRILYEKFGNWQDKIAWQGLLKMIDKEEIIRETQSNALKEYHRKPEVKDKYRKLNEKRWSDEKHRQHVSNCTKEQWKDPNFIKVHSDFMKEYNQKNWADPEKREKLTLRNQKNNRKVISLSDGKITTWSSRVKHERKTGYKHEWKDYFVEKKI
jgi:hypothetical protein